MNKLVKISMLSLAFFLATFTAQAQGFGGKGSKYFQLGFGASSHFQFYNDNKINDNYVYRTALNFNAQFEFGIHKYIGLGLHVGFDFSPNGGAYYYAGYYPGYYTGSTYSTIGIPVAFFGNFHFLQLIADKTGNNFADKLDVYAGLSVGSGPAFAVPKRQYKDAPYNYSTAVGFMVFGGPHVGIRFFPKDNFGIYAEVGYGKTYGTFGVVFKM